MHSLCRFTQNLSAFRREVNDSMKNSTYGVNSNDMMSWQLSDSTCTEQRPFGLVQRLNSCKGEGLTDPSSFLQRCGGNGNGQLAISPGNTGVCVHSLRGRALLVPGGLGGKGGGRRQRYKHLRLQPPPGAIQAGRAQCPATTCLV